MASRGTKVVVALIAGSVGLVSATYPHSYGWAGAILAVVGAVAAPIFAYRSYLKEPRFWVAFILLTILPVPLLIAVRPIVDNLRFPALFIFAITDCMVVVVVIYGVIYWPRSPQIRG